MVRIKKYYFARFFDQDLTRANCMITVSSESLVHIYQLENRPPSNKAEYGLYEALLWGSFERMKLHHHKVCKDLRLLSKYQIINEFYIETKSAAFGCNVSEKQLLQTFLQLFRLLTFFRFHCIKNRLQAKKPPILSISVLKLCCKKLSTINFAKISIMWELFSLFSW